MDLLFQKFSDTEEELLVNWLTSEVWPFHGQPQPEADEIRRACQLGRYASSDSRTFWIIINGQTRIGLIRLFDLQDQTPVFDIRLLRDYRGRGYGTQALQWLTDYVFTTWPQKRRIEGYTRQDNRGMRRVFLACGYLKEAHHRQAWPGQKNEYYDSIGYAILRDDWMHGRQTAVNWQDEL
ncbi:GNAT family N-acetyltransferase [candidate division CSSED10-310 bacterium]|uniref:GNAT family N-acetyltransferase n=1 Tax=candidate division CSSED10-310 bacterium TaxID=2855610 RepID=A0ABV6YTE7_UNCC1